MMATLKMGFIRLARGSKYREELDFMKIEFRSGLLGENLVEFLPGFKVAEGAVDIDGDDEELTAQDEAGGTPCIIEGEREQLIRGVSAWLSIVGDQAVYVSGDDDYFDYYPDNFYVADQIVPQLKDAHLTEHLERVRQRAIDVRYWDMEPECLGGNTEEYVKSRDKELGDAAQRFIECWWNRRLEQYRHEA